MENIQCSKCTTSIVIEEDNLFFPEKTFEVNILCPKCKHKITTRKTDGWFFIQTEEEYAEVVRMNLLNGD